MASMRTSRLLLLYAISFDIQLRLSPASQNIETLDPSIRSDILRSGYLLLQDIVPDTTQAATGQPPSATEYGDKSKPKSSLETLCAIVDFLSVIDPNPCSRHKLVSHTGENAQIIMHCLQAVSKVPC